MKRNIRRILSGLLSTVVVLSAFLQPFAAIAAESDPAAHGAEYPMLGEVRDRLDEDEVVSASDHGVEYGSSFDVEHDFTGMEIHGDKVKVTLYETKDETGHVFSTDRAGIYKAVYYVRPVSGAPSYQIHRNITVRERPAPTTGQTADESAGDRDSDGEDDPDPDPAGAESETQKDREDILRAGAGGIPVDNTASTNDKTTPANTP